MKRHSYEVDLSQILLPMAGVALLVLIMLIATAPYLLTNSNVKVNIPKAHVIETELEQSLVITVDKNGRFYYNGKPCKKDSLFKYVYNDLIKEPEDIRPYKLIIIRGDKDVDYGSILWVLDQVKKAGAKRTVFAVIKEKG